MLTFFSRDVSAWQFDKTTNSGGFSAGVAAYQSGNVILRSPDGKSYAFKYRAAGGGIGANIKLPMKIPGRKLFGISVTGLTRDIRRSVNKVTGFIEGASRDGGGYVASDLNDQVLPDWADPSAGTIFIGPGCKISELRPEDFEGWCVICNIDMGIGLGITGTGMLFGLEYVSHSWFVEYVMNTVPGGRTVRELEALANARGLMFFGGADIDFRAGGGVAVLVGRMTRNETTDR